MSPAVISTSVLVGFTLSYPLISIADSSTISSNVWFVTILSSASVLSVIGIKILDKKNVSNN